MANGEPITVSKDARELYAKSLLERMDSTTGVAQALATAVAEVVGHHVGTQERPKEQEAEASPGLFGQMNTAMDAIDTSLGDISVQISRL